MKKQRPAQQPYTTWEEKRFIDSLGTYSEQAYRSGQRSVEPTPRKELLKRYAKASKNRDWQNLNGPEIIAHLHVSMVDAGVDLKTICGG